MVQRVEVTFKKPWHEYEIGSSKHMFLYAVLKWGFSIIALSGLLTLFVFILPGFSILSSMRIKIPLGDIMSYWYVILFYILFAAIAVWTWYKDIVAFKNRRARNREKGFWTDPLIIEIIIVVVIILFLVYSFF